MVDSLAAVVLAAGAGERLRPFTSVTSKVLCPVGTETLLAANLRRVAGVVGAGPQSIAVNVHHHAALVVAAVGGAAHTSVEVGQALGTAGGVAALGPWLDGRPVLVVNGDTWTTIDLGPLVEGWDSTRVRVLVTGADDLVPGVGIIGSLLPPPVVATLPLRPAGLYETAWKAAQREGRLEVVRAEGPFVSVDRPGDLLRANLTWSGGASVVGEGAVVEGEVERSLIWPGAVVRRGEHLVDAIRMGDRMTVLVR